MERDSLLHTLEAVDKQPVVDDLVSERFFAAWPLERLFGTIAASAWEPSASKLIYTGLTKLLQTAHGSKVLPTASMYLLAALQSPVVNIRLLGTEQLGRLLRLAAGEQQQMEIAAHITACLKDPDTSIAVAAERSLAAFTAHSPPRLLLVTSQSAPSGQLLRQLAADSSATLRLRSCAAVLGMAGGCMDEAPAFLHDSGILNSLVLELTNGLEDPLALLASLELLRDLSTSQGGALALPLACLALPALAPSLQDASLLPSVLQPATSLLAATLLQHNASAAAQVPGSEAVLAAIIGALDPSGSVPYEAELAALDAAGELAHPKGGAELLLLGSGGAAGRWVADRALGRDSPQELRVAALHALAALAGAERGANGGLSASAACLSPEAEHALRTAVYAATSATPTPTTPSEALSALLSRPFDDLRAALYRCVAALALRPWAASEICSHPELLSRLLSPSTESRKAACEWRHTCVLSLDATIRSAGMLRGAAAGADAAELRPVLEAIAPRIAAAAAAGPFGAAPGRGEGAEGSAGGIGSQVATMRSG